MAIDYERLEIIVRCDISEPISDDRIKMIVYNATLTDDAIEVKDTNFVLWYHPETYEQLDGGGGYDPTQEEGGES